MPTSQRLAVREGGVLYFLLTDHLGSTSLTTNASGAVTAEVRYAPFGTDRYTTGTTPTSYRFTGQRKDATIGLYFYNSRYYDPLLGRFIQADTLVPNPSVPQSLNRYTYTLNNPVKYTDPSGHFEQEAIKAYLQSIYPDNWSDVLNSWQQDEDWWGMLDRAQAGDILYGYYSACITSDCETIDPLMGTFAFTFEGEGRTVLDGISATPVNRYSNANHRIGIPPLLEDIRVGHSSEGTWFHWSGIVHWDNKNNSKSTLNVSSYSRDHSDLELETFDKLAYWVGRLSAAATTGLMSGAIGGGPIGGAATALIVDSTDITNKAGHFYANQAIPPGNISITIGPLSFQLTNFQGNYQIAH